MNGFRALRSAFLTPYGTEANPATGVLPRPRILSISLLYPAKPSNLGGVLEGLGVPTVLSHERVPPLSNSSPGWKEDYVLKKPILFMVLANCVIKLPSLFTLGAGVNKW